MLIPTRTGRERETIAGDLLAAFQIFDVVLKLPQVAQIRDNDVANCVDDAVDGAYDPS